MKCILLSPAAVSESLYFTVLFSSTLHIPFFLLSTLQWFIIAWYLEISPEIFFVCADLCLHLFTLPRCSNHGMSLIPPPALQTSQLLRKRHIGNDIVTIVFQEPGALPFTPKNIRSHFQHVFVIVKVHNPCTDNVCYRWAEPQRTPP